MEGEYCIRLKPDSVPYAIHTARRVPIPLREAVKKELDKMEMNGVIRKVEGPTEWCAGIVPVLKPSGEVRICVDLTQLNKNVKRERFVLPTVDETIALLSGAAVFSKLDANSGFHQVRLAKECQQLTTFITPYGRYCFERLPFGITSAPEYFQKRMNEILDGMPGVVNMMDDVLVFGSNQQEHDERLHRTLERLHKAGITLNKEKCQFSVKELSFLGFLVSKDGIRPDPAKVRAIADMKAPTSVAEVRRLLGLANHCSRFIPNLADKTAPLRQLLQKNTDWIWTDAQEKAMECLKKAICSDSCMAKYDPRYPTILSADASSYGLGAVLLQLQPNNEQRPVVFVSRALTPTEMRYAQIEKETLALTWAAERLESYLRGLHFTVETDHKPLVTLLGKSPLDLLPPRIQRFRMRLMRFSFDVEYVPGKNLVIADALSRAPLREQRTAKCLSVEEVSSFVAGSLSELGESDSFRSVAEEQACDEVCQRLIRYTREGWPSLASLPAELKPYWQERGTLSVCKGVLLKGSRLVVPQSLRSMVMKQLHEGHQGIVRCRARALESVWWPGLSSQLASIVTNCRVCAEYRDQPAEPMIPTRTPSRPWERVAADIFHMKGSNYLLVVDYFSRFPELCRLESLTSPHVVEQLKSVFSRHGIPEVLVSDNGKQFVSQEFDQFSREYRFRRVTSSPRYPQANGEVERMVKTIKGLLLKSNDPFLALLAYRDTPGQLGSTPAELLMSRRLRTTLPLHPKKLAPSTQNLKEVRRKDTLLRDAQRRFYNRRHAARHLPQLEPGEGVWVKDRREKGVILKLASRPRSYVVELDKGGRIERNRRALVQLKQDRESVENSDDCYEFPEGETDGGVSAECLSRPGSIGQNSPLQGLKPNVSLPAVPPEYVTRSGRTVRKPERYGVSECRVFDLCLF